MVEFIETTIFSKVARNLLSDDELNRLQMVLLLYPSSGAVIPQSGGLRKLRWATSSIGKRGGLRVIYYSVSQDNKIFLLYVYKKSQQEDLTLEQLKYLKSLLEE